MTPYLVLTNAEKSKVQKVLEEHALDDLTLGAAIVLLEEMGPDSETVRRALAWEEYNGNMREGTFRELMPLMNRSYSADWRAIPRHGRKL